MTRIDLFRNDDEYLTFAAGDVIFREGDAGDRMFTVIDGEVDILVGDRVVDTTTAGGLLGEMAVIDTQPRSATAIARTAAKLVPIDQRRFLFLVQQTPFFAIQVMQMMATRHRRLLALADERKKAGG
jgi:CRP/FNR family cyclic AMP-dependent transcriptional regulator